MQRLARLLPTTGLVLVLGLAACGDDDDTLGVCAPSCNASACLACDVSGDIPQCVSVCGDGLSCEDGACIAPEAISCDPACGDCEFCDTTGEAPACVGYCGEGTACNAETSACDPLPACDPACDGCSTCDTTVNPPVCVSSCSEAQRCDETGETPTCFLIRGEDDAKNHAGRFEATSFDDGPAVTAECLRCHTTQASQMLEAAHWTWEGPSPNTVDENGTALNPTGKNKLINNFCIAIASNEARCTQCHAGYGYTSGSFDFEDTSKIDCLICHADPAAGYKKVKAPGGSVDPSVDLMVAASSVGMPTRANCGGCHFKAGGGDNVKKGDMGSSLANPTRDGDVHMGSGNSCTACHEASDHKIPGKGIHLPVNEGRVACTDCHSGTIHDDAVIESHATGVVACQSCHVPAFSRKQPTKMDWLWGDAGDMNKEIPKGEVTLADGSTVEVNLYDWMKGTFQFGANVRPAYAWYDGGVQRLTTDSKSFFAGDGTLADPIVIAGPTAAAGAGKIFPFKLMTGNQPVDIAGDFLVVPKLFGPVDSTEAFWRLIPPLFADDATPTPEQIEQAWDTALTAGARVAGQILETESYKKTAPGADERAWDWQYTQMYMGINHEVAPSSQALGCTDCHLDNPEFDFTALGYICDPMTGGADDCRTW